LSSVMTAFRHLAGFDRGNVYGFTDLNGFQLEKQR